MNLIEMREQPQTGDRDLPQERQPTAPTPTERTSVPERKWAIECTDPKSRQELRSPFERLAAHAAEVELRTKYEHRFQAVDAWPIC
jgi:hypothetical protein